MANIEQPSQHLIIPFASSLDAACQAAIKTLTLPNLTRFFKQAEVVDTDSGDEFDFIPPHERAIQASVRAELVQAQVVVTPCHWSVGIDNIRMENTDDLQLTDAESKDFFAAIHPYFLEDGIGLTYQSAMVWHASSSLFNDLPVASLDRAIGRNVDVWQPPAAQSKSIRRLQNEMQMLLYTHPLNEAREARGLPTVNSFWLSRQVCAPADSDFFVDNALRQSALRSDWQSWRDGWQAMDSKIENALSPVGHTGQGLQITLCGERHSIRLAETLSRTITQKIKRLFKPAPSIQSVLASL
jgi:hypothetical protein